MSRINQRKMMPRFKKPYRIAAAGAAAAGAAGLAAGLATEFLLPKDRSELSLALRMMPLLSAALFATMYYPPYCRRVRGPRVFLTFDDGPDPESTPDILDALEAAGGRGAFFLIGEAVESHPELVRRIAAGGHAIGLHGYGHEAVTLRTAASISQEFGRALNAVHRAAPSAQVRWYRPPFGLRGPGLAPALRRWGLTMALWTLDSHDYLLRHGDRIRERVSSSLQCGDIVLLHDAGETGRATALALPAILDTIYARGWQAAALPEGHS